MKKRKGVTIPYETAVYYQRLDLMVARFNGKSKIGMTWDQFESMYPEDARWIHREELQQAVEDYR